MLGLIRSALLSRSSSPLVVSLPRSGRTRRRRCRTEHGNSVARALTRQGASCASFLWNISGSVCMGRHEKGVTPSSLDRLKTRTTARVPAPHERSLKRVIAINFRLKGVFDHFLFTSFRSRGGQLLGREGGRLPVRWEGAHDAIVQGAVLPGRRARHLRVARGGGRAWVRVPSIIIFII